MSAARPSSEQVVFFGGGSRCFWEGAFIHSTRAQVAPATDRGKGNTLILLARDYDHIPDRDDRLYLSPPKETEADKIDFTDPEKIARTGEKGIKAEVRYLKPND